MATKTPLLGSKIRSKRRSRSLTQAELARRLGISASYLNLIEKNQRPLTAELLIKLAAEFKLELSDFAVDEDRRLAAHLMEAFADPVFEDHGINSADVRELASASPAIGRAVLELYEQFGRARGSLAELAEQDYAEQQGSPGRAASLASEALPSEEVNDFVQRHMNHVDALERLAEQLWVDARLERGARFAGMARWLERQGYGVQLVSGDGRIVRRYDRDLRRISLSESLAPASRNFQLAAQIALLCHHELLEELTDTEEGLSSASARTLARLVLANYFAGAVLMPYEGFVRAARAQRYDIELLVNRFGTSFEQACHRLSTLRRPGSEGVPFHMLRVDIAGNISKRFSGSGIRFARFSGACPRWNVFRAFQTPGMIRVQTSIMPDGETFFCVARTVQRSRGGHGVPRSTMAIGLGCPLDYASELVYADGVDLQDRGGMLPVGVTCRLCDRQDCEQRVLPSLRQPLVLREDVRGVSLFSDPEAR